MKTKMKLEKVLRLNEELHLFVKEKLALGLKFKIEVYTKSLSVFVNAAQESRKELFLKLAEGQNEIPQFLDKECKVKNPVFEAVNKEWALLMSEDVEVSEPIKIPLSDIEKIETDNSYPLIFELMIEETKN